MIRLNLDQQKELVDEPSPFQADLLFGRAWPDENLAEAYDDALCQMIEGRDRRMVPEMLDLVRGATGTLKTCRIEIDLLRHIGIDPLAALGIAIILGRVRFELQADEDLIASVNITNDGTIVHLADDVLWNGTSLVCRIPDTLAHAARGRRLRDVVSHPVLDRHDLTVVDVQSLTDIDCMVLATDADPTPVTAEEMEREWKRFCEGKTR